MDTNGPNRTKCPKWEQGGPKWTEYNKVDQRGLNKNIWDQYSIYFCYKF